MLRNATWGRRVAHLAAVWMFVSAVIVGALGGVSSQPLYAQDDVEEANKALVAMLYTEVVNNRNFDILLEYSAPDLIEHTRDGDIVYATPEEHAAATAAEFEQIPPLEVVINYQLAEGDQVITNFTITLVNEGITANGLSVFRIVDGKLVEMEEILDELAIVTGLGLVPGLGEEGAGEEGMGEEGMMAEEVIADGFNGPMGILADADGNLWVIDSGIGGDIEFEMPNPETGEMSTVFVGDTSRIVMIAADGTQSEVALLPSVLIGEEASGGSRLTALDGVLYATSGGWLEGLADERMPLMASIVAVNADGTVTEVANTWDIENSENAGGFALDSHPYDIAAGPDGLLWIADAGANAVLTVDPESGEVAVVAVIDPIAAPFPNPDRGDAMETDSVPTGVVPDEGGAYVSLLPGFPFVPGSAKVVWVSTEGEVSDYATGLTMLTDLQAGPDGELYAVQMGVFTDQGPTPNSGAIWRIQEGEESELIYPGLSFPTSIDFNAEGDAYITINGVGAPGSGAVIYIPAMTEMSEVLPVEPDGGIGTTGPLPVPDAAMGPAIPQDKGYLVEEIGDGLYWVTDGSYQIMFLTTGEGVIVVDAPPSMGEKILAAIDEVTDEPITHVIYSHAHADHLAGASLYPADAIYIAQEETAATLAERGADDESLDLPFGVLVGGGPVPLPTETFGDSYTLEVGSQVLELAYHGANHAHGNTFVYAPAQKVLMVVDVVFPGWTPFLNLAVSESVPGYLAAHDEILAYDFDIYIGGHLGRYGTCEDVETQQEYMMDISANALTALQTVDFMAIAAETGFDNPWLLFGTYFDAAAETCAALTLEEWGGVLGGADLFTKSHCDRIIESMRVD